MQSFLVTISRCFFSTLRTSENVFISSSYTETSKLAFYVKYLSKTADRKQRLLFFQVFFCILKKGYRT